MADNEKSRVWYAAADPARSGKWSVLAGVEVVVSVAVYWWIAVTWQTHLHLLVALIAAPLVLLRSDASVARAQGMCDAYLDSRNDIPLESLKGIGLVLLCGLSGFGMAWTLSKTWLAPHDGWALFWRAGVVAWGSWNVGLGLAIAIARLGAEAVTEAAAVAVVGVVAATVSIAGPAVEAVAGAVAAAVAAAGAVVFPGLIVGLWLRSLATRAASVLLHPLVGIRAMAGNWRRLMLEEDASHAPELLPGIEQNHSIFRFDHLGQKWQEGDAGDKIIAVLTLVFLFLPSLIWRYSLKFTFWFYAPLIYVSARGKFADPAHRRLMIDRIPPPLEWLRAIAAAVALTFAAIAFIDWFALLGLMRHVEVLSPVGWLLVLDWGKLWDQPWQIPSILSAALTILIFLWIGTLRSYRRRLEETGEDPETAMDRAFSTELHPGLTLYRLNRLRTVLVTLSLVVGFWYFAKGSYEAGYLTSIEPFLSSIFGPR